MGDSQTAFNSFVQSGQIWALLIGLVIGYVLRGLTTYGDITFFWAQRQTST